MKRIALLILLFVSASHIQAQTTKQEEICYNPNLIKDTTKKSIKSAAIGMIGSDSIIINYHSPGVRGRILWGGLVPFDEVWVTGAHNATNIIFPKAVSIGGKVIPAGQYALFTIPGRDEWIVILNKHWEQHLASEYDEKDDVVRLKVKPQTKPHTERLQYFVEAGNNREAIIAMQWEKVRIAFPIAIQ